MIQTSASSEADALALLEGCQRHPERGGVRAIHPGMCAPDGHPDTATTEL